MMNELKLSFQMMKYAYGIKMNMVACGIMLLLGWTLEIITHGTSWVWGIFILAAPIYGVQFLYCTSLSDMVVSSPYRKRLQTSMPAMITFISNLPIFTLEVIFRMICIRNYPQDEEKILLGLLVMSLMNLMFGIYVALAFKYFVASMVIIMVVSSIIGMLISMIRIFGEEYTEILHGLWFMNQGTVIGIAYFMVCLTAAAQYLVSLAIHKKPLSKRAQGASMKKYL